MCLLAHAALLTVSSPGTLCFWTKRAAEGQELSQVRARHSIRVSAKKKKKEGVLIGEFIKKLFSKAWTGFRKTNRARCGIPELVTVMDPRPDGKWE